MYLCLSIPIFALLLSFLLPVTVCNEYFEAYFPELLSNCPFPRLGRIILRRGQLSSRLQVYGSKHGYGERTW